MSPNQESQIAGGCAISSSWVSWKRCRHASITLVRLTGWSGKPVSWHCPISHPKFPKACRATYSFQSLLLLPIRLARACDHLKFTVCRISIRSGYLFPEPNVPCAAGNSLAF